MKEDECNYSHSKLEQRNFLTTTTSHQKYVTDTNETGSPAYKPSETNGCSQSSQSGSHLSNKDIEQRMVRIESRLVQLMLHMGLDPYNKVYE